MPKGPTRGHRAPTNAPAHDDPERWVETVIASLPARSTKDREALLKALVDGDALPPETHPVSGTIDKSLRIGHFLASPPKTRLFDASVTVRCNVPLAKRLKSRTQPTTIGT